MLAETILDGLNPEQRRAVEITEGPLLILAGAGSGKTRVLVHRIAYLIGACGIPAEQILAVTFTNKAAGEMRERVEKLLGPAAEGLWVTTFHSACVRILRRDAGHLGFSRGFVIYDEDDSLSLVKEALRRHDLDPKVHDPRRLRWRIDQFKNKGWLPARAAEAAHDLDSEQAAELYATYQRLLAEANALDFGDLILQTAQLFERFPEVLAYYRRRWHYVLVDEYQDTNRVQYDLVTMLAAEHKNLCVVGDGDQSIYGWRGADVRNILDFERDYPDTQVVKLESNYRSTRAILEGASHVVAHNETSKGLKLRAERGDGELLRFFEAGDERAEAAFVVKQILTAAREGRSPRDFAIFYRTNAQSRPFEEELLRYNVPYSIIGGVRFYERAEVKDALSYLRIALNPADAAALRRIVNAPPRGIGKTTVDRADAIAQRDGVTLLEGLQRLAAEGGAGRAAGPIREFVMLHEELARDIRTRPLAESIANLLQRSGYLRHLEAEGSPEAQTRLENLRELISAAEDFSVESTTPGDEERSAVELFLDQVALVADVDGWDRRAERVSLMTVHSAKGLEFPTVFLVGLEEGIFPHAVSSRDPNGIEEERRLFYVGMTRAMERLVLTCARERRRYGTRTFGVPSRFLREIPEGLISGAGPATPRQAKPELDFEYAHAEYDEVGGEIPRGMRVRHPVFGQGTVLDVAGNGAAQKLRIKFDRVGVKTLLTRFANLEPG